MEAEKTIKILGILNIIYGSTIFLISLIPIVIIVYILSSYSRLLSEIGIMTGMYSSIYIIVIAIILFFLLLGIGLLLGGIGLLAHKKWARSVIITFSIIAFIPLLLSLISIISVISNLSVMHSISAGGLGFFQLIVYSFCLLIPILNIIFMFRQNIKEALENSQE